MKTDPNTPRSLGSSHGQIPAYYPAAHQRSQSTGRTYADYRLDRTHIQAFTRPPQPTNAPRTGSKPSDESRLLSSALNNSNLKDAKTPSEIKEALADFRSQITKAGADQNTFLKLNKLEHKLLDKTGNIHQQATLMRLLQGAAMKVGSSVRNGTPEADKAFKLVEKALQGQPGALAQLQQIRQKLPGIHLNRLDVPGSLRQLNPPKTTLEATADFASIIDRSVTHAASTNRLAKEDSGLKNTVIVTEDDQPILLKNSVNPNDENEDLSLRKDLLRRAQENGADGQDISENRTHQHREKDGELKALFGKGGFGKVRPGMTIDGKPVGVKKMDSSEHARQEILEKEKLQRRFAHRPDLLKHFLLADSMAVSKGKDGEIKAYVISPMQRRDGLEEVRKLQSDRPGSRQFAQAHAALIGKTLETCRVLTDNELVHGDLKWENLIGGKIADIDGLTYRFGDSFRIHTPEYLPPELKVRDGAFIHPNKESYDKHTSFTLGRMLLESVDPNLDRTFPLPKTGRKVNQGYSSATAVPTMNSEGRAFSNYEKDIIRLGYQLADTVPGRRPSVAQAQHLLREIKNKYGIA